MPHPAYTDLFCDRHEHWHQEDICPICEVEDEEDFCAEHNEWHRMDEKCERCEERYQDELSQRALSQDGAR